MLPTGFSVFASSRPIASARSCGPASRRHPRRARPARRPTTSAGDRSEPHARPGPDEGSAQPPPAVAGGRPAVRVDLDDADGAVEALHALQAPQSVHDAVGLAGQVGDRLGGQHLAGARQRAQPRRAVERAAAEAVVDGDRLAGVEADPDAARQRGGGQPPLELDREAQRLARGVEDQQRLVAAQLLEVTLVGGTGLRGDGGEAPRQSGGGLVAVLAGVARVAADVGEQERAQRRRGLRRGRVPRPCRPPGRRGRRRSARTRVE